LVKQSPTFVKPVEEGFGVLSWGKKKLGGGEEKKIELEWGIIILLGGPEAKIPRVTLWDMGGGEVSGHKKKEFGGEATGDEELRTSKRKKFTRIGGKRHQERP